MHVPIGHTLDGQSVQVHLAQCSVVVLIGDPRSGRTTLARHLARCWLADLAHGLHLDVDRAHEYSDLAGLAAWRGLVGGSEPTHPDTRTQRLLTLHDHQLPTNLPFASGPAVITTGPAVAVSLAESLGRPPSCLVAIGPYRREWSRLRRARFTATDDLQQERIDLPARTLTIRVASFGVADQPPHRWQMTDGASSLGRHERRIMTGAP
jgi:hypothetical protein